MTTSCKPELIHLKIGVVGPCGSGKSTLVHRLKIDGYDVSHIAQEHSFVPDMWRRITNPDILIYLDVSHGELVHRNRLEISATDFMEQCDRLNHARLHADQYILTDNLSPGEIYSQIAIFLHEWRTGQTHSSL